MEDDLQFPGDSPPELRNICDELLANPDFFSTIQNVPLFQDITPGTDFDLLGMADNMISQISGSSQQLVLNEKQDECEIDNTPAEYTIWNDISNFAGAYGFTVGYPRQDDRGAKGSSWIYSEELDQLYVKMNRDCPIQVLLSRPVPFSSVIRVTPIYRRLSDQSDLPKRCLNHSGINHETNKDHKYPEHLLRSYMPGSEHVEDNRTGRKSLLLPCDFIQRYVPLTYILRFMCRTSCVGGMNRRPFSVVFTLEHDGKCLGRQVKKVHVCEAPRRDRKIEETRLARIRSGELRDHNQEMEDLPRPRQQVQFQPSSLVQDIKTACKRVSTSSDGKTASASKHRKVYAIKVSNLKTYKVLCAMKPIVEANLKKQDTENSTEESS